MSLSTNDMIELNRQSIEKIEKEIIEAGKHITQIEENIEAAIKGNNIEEVDYLRNEEEHLRNKEAQLRNEKAQLRDKELLLLKTSEYIKYLYMYINMLFL